MTGKELAKKIQEWKDNHFGVPNTFNIQLLIDFYYEFAIPIIRRAIVDACLGKKSIECIAEELGVNFYDLHPYIMMRERAVAEEIKRDRPKIVCLCGSTKFKDAFTKAQLDKTLAGKIVLTIGCNMKSDTEIFGHLNKQEFDTIKLKLDELHKRKIDLADEVMILNVGGYIGESTRNELNYAIKHNKQIIYLEPIGAPSGKDIKEG